MKKKFRSSIAVLNLLFLILVFSGCKQKAEIPRLTGEMDYNLLVITLDTTRADRIGCYGYQGAETPNIDYLAEKGVRFENCYASVPLTLPSHVTLFTGREPIGHLVLNNGTYVLRSKETTLAETMRSRSYQTYAVTASFVLHSKFGLSQGFDFYDDSLDFNTAANNLQTEIDAEKVYSRFNSWLGKNHAEKFFSWVHFYDPHNPYDPPPIYKERFKDNYYDGEIAYVDHFIGKMVEDLETLNILSRTLIVIVGDHGEAFGEHKEYGHGIFCYQESIKVPLIFSHPELFKETNRTVFQCVCLADIMPTILNLYGINIPENIHGKSLAPLFFRDSETEETQIYLESMFANEDMGWAPLTGMILNQFKYISLPTPELYDLRNDPEERKNLFQEKNSLAREIDGRLREYIQNHLEDDSPARRKLTTTDKSRLESLGYISGFSSRSQGLIDPKNGIELMNEVMAVKEMFDEGKTEEAAIKLDGLLTSNQEIKIPLLYDNLFNLYKDRGDQEKALKILEEAVELFPGQIRFRLNLALQYFGAGKRIEAEQICLELIEEDPDLAQIYNLLGGIYKTKGELDKAVSFFEEALRIEPLNVLMQLNYAEAELERNLRSEAKKILASLLNNEVLMSDPESSPVRVRIGILLAKSGDYDRAIELLSRIIKNQNADAEVWTHLGLAYFETGNLQKAQEAYDRSLEIDEDYALTLSSLGTLNLALFQRQRKRDFHTLAIKFYQRAIAVDADIATAYNGLAVAYRYENKNEQAVSLWKKTLEIKPDFTNAYINLGMTLIAMGQRAEALRYLTLCRERYFSRLNEVEQVQLQDLIEKVK